MAPRHRHTQLSFGIRRAPSLTIEATLLMLEFFERLFSTDFMPHGYCLRLPGLIALHAASDGVIALSYFLIPISLMRLVRARNLLFPGMFLLFSLFIFTCGTTHALAVWTLWTPVYRFDGLVKVITAAASFLTAVLLIRLSPKARALPSPVDLQRANQHLKDEVERRERAEEQVRQLNVELEHRLTQLDAALALAGQKADVQKQALAEAETNMQFILDLLPAMVCYIDSDLRYRRVNRSYEQFFERSADEIQGRTMPEVLGPDHYRELEPNVRQALQGQPVRFERAFRYPIGVRDVEISYSPDKDEDGHVRGFAALISDISERKRAEEVERRHVELLNQTLEPLLIWELHGPIEYWNRAAEELYGFSKGEAIGQISHDLLQTVRPMATLAEFEAILENRGRWTGELTHTTRDGRQIFVLSRHKLTIQPDGRRLVLESNRDITERRQMELDLRRLNETLEANVRERTEQLSEANRELEAFSYSVSHDLRAPLRSVDGFGRILLREYPGKVLDDRGTHYIRRMSAATVRMGQLIEDLLKLSQVSRSPLRKQPVDITQMANEVWREICPENPTRRVESSIQSGLQANADGRLLRIVLQNLLRNAWKFTSKKEGPVAIAVGSSLVDGRQAYFVRDNGAGFDMAYAEQLFAPFQRLHTSKEFKGSGIGLAIVQRIIQRHGGSIWAHGKPNEGATFFFTLGE